MIGIGSLNMPRKAKQLTDLQVRRLKHGVVKGMAKNKDAAKNPKGTPCTALHAVGGVGGCLASITLAGLTTIMMAG